MSWRQLALALMLLSVLNSLITLVFVPRRHFGSMGLPSGGLGDLVGVTVTAVAASVVVLGGLVLIAQLIRRTRRTA